MASLLGTDWRSRAPEVQALIQEILKHDLEIHEIEARARKRASLGSMAALEGLVLAVEAARTSLLATLGVSGDELRKRLSELEAQAGDEAHLVRAWERFDAERFWFSSMAAALGVILAASTAVGFFWGGFHVVWPQPPSEGLLVPGFAFVGASYFRLASWEWLGFRLPRAGWPLLAGASTFGLSLVTTGHTYASLVWGGAGLLVSAGAATAWQLWHPEPSAR